MKTMMMIAIIALMLMIAYEIYRCYWLKKALRTETWLPIVHTDGSVHGKIAASVAQECTIKYLHPVIRIALIHNGMLFLKERPDSDRQLDFPVERHLRYGESLEEGVKKAFLTHAGTSGLPANFMFRYEYKVPPTHRLIYLYACNIVNKNQLDELHLGEGKWWTVKQIEDNLGSTIFSPYFEEEFEFLDSTVLMVDRMMRESKAC
ncbi:MAG: hypothetical protein LBN93_12210 [Candidatus Symbiothrix sp.]|jgi:hypothetical protein|nr:hypothetical protein [Candidatus Symbiothrix sp.]